MNVGSFLKVLAGLGNLPLYWLTRLLPVERNLWVFGAWFGERYGDSPRAIFEQVAQPGSGIRAVWLSNNRSIVAGLRDLGYEAYPIHSVRGYWLTARSDWAVVCTSLRDVNRYAPMRRVLNTWHGVPTMKRIMRDSATFRETRPVVRTLAPYARWDLRHDVLACSPEEQKIMCSAFGVDRSHVHVTGLPRQDTLVPTPGYQNQLRGLYLPTHRAEGKGSAEVLFVGIEDLDQALSSVGTRVWVKLHHYHGGSMLPEDLSNVRVLDDSAWDFDLYRELAGVDFLITDYSSVAIDFLITDRPIIYFAPDVDDYVSTEERGTFYNEYSEVVAGPICSSWKEVAFELQDLAEGKDRFAPRRAALRSRFVPRSDGGATERVVDLMRRG